MSDRGHIRADFERLVKGPEDSLDLARAALLVAAESDPNVDIDAQLHTLESWASELRARLQPDWNNLQKLARLRNFVYEELGFRGEHRDYYSPKNSLLHEVIQNRTGIPLTLSIVFMELGWRIGMPLEGVGFPSHFLVRLAGEPGDLLLDPYRDGCSVSLEECRGMLEQASGGRLSFDEALLASTSKRETIVRLLMNLKGAYLRANRDEEALLAVDRLLVIHPGDPNEVRDRGLLLYRLRRYGSAFDALRNYLEARPEAEDRESIAQHLDALRRLIAELN
ncbi:MAG: tetratricopeptide repeat protein [Candidatus Eisenbacteria bacterium]|uniref:Tetratricopeptide repeat protein n=1 Tax=Eiseniibacteriota bacterium TaxID=2212470 RepID=A0A849SMU7_UNCEI|nr:tetratricopeptide repeat protein [Candidatus Eisenbacteria bacterium]